MSDIHFSYSIANSQWYPGHIAKTEKELKEQLRLMDVVIEIRDARIPLSTSHPKVMLLVIPYIYLYKRTTSNCTESCYV
jgi:ribosome biogenesis GTPase A